jgi:Bacterial capsule synthesis protein PGA_cap
MELTIALCGDIMLGAEVAQYMGDATVADWLAGVSPAWREADLLIANLESPCVVEAKPALGGARPPELVFHASADRLQELSAAGFSALTLANNHALDCGPGRG